MNHLINFTLGSMYGSGHGRKENYIVKSNLDGDRLVAIHKTMKKELGFEISEILEEYRERVIRPDILETLASHSLLTLFSRKSYSSKF